MDEEIESKVEVRICGDEKEANGGLGLDGRVVLGRDFWERRAVVVCWADGKAKKKGKENEKKKKQEGNEEFLGLMLGEKKIRFEMT